MTEHLKALGVILMAIALLALAIAWLPIRADDGTIDDVMPTTHYRLDNGDDVYVWIDDVRALLCVEVRQREPSRGSGLSCLPLTDTVYNWPALQETSGEQP